MSLKKEILTLVTKILKEENAGSKLTWEENKDTRKLHHLLLQTSRWRNAVNLSSMFKILNRTYRGRKYKNLSIMVGSKLVPVTKKMINQIGKKPVSKRTLILKLLRELVESQMKSEKRAQVSILERKTFTHINPTKYHLDHDTPFIQLAVEWCKAEGFDSFDSLPGKKTYGDNWKFPTETEESWKKYHQDKAVLILKTAQVNLSESSKGYKAEF